MIAPIERAQSKTPLYPDYLRKQIRTTYSVSN